MFKKPSAYLKVFVIGLTANDRKVGRALARQFYIIDYRHQ